MKKLLLFLLILVSGNALFSQIKLEKTIDNTANKAEYQFVNLSQQGTKLVALDTEKGELTFYNEDYTLYKKVNIELILSPSTSKAMFFNIGYISDNLFNLDNKIEFLVQYSDWTKPTVRVYSETGEILFEKIGRLPTSEDYSKMPVSIYEVGGKSKMIINSVDYKSTEIYTLPGNLLLSVTDVEADKTKYDIKLFPNPASQNKISIAYTLPDNIKLNKVNIYNTLGQVVKTVKLDNQSNNSVDIDTQNLQKGTYFCELIGNKGKISASQFVIQ